MRMMRIVHDQRLCPWTHWGLCPQTALICSGSALTLCPPLPQTLALDPAVNRCSSTQSSSMMSVAILSHFTQSTIPTMICGLMICGWNRACTRVTAACSEWLRPLSVDQHQTHEVLTVVDREAGSVVWWAALAAGSRWLSAVWPTTECLRTEVQLLSTQLASCQLHAHGQLATSETRVRTSWMTTTHRTATVYVWDTTLCFKKNVTLLTFAKTWVTIIQFQ